MRQVENYSLHGHAWSEIGNVLNVSFLPKYLRISPSLHWDCSPHHLFCYNLEEIVGHKLFSFPIQEKFKEAGAELTKLVIIFIKVLEARYSYDSSLEKFKLRSIPWGILFIILDFIHR